MKPGLCWMLEPDSSFSFVFKVDHAVVLKGRGSLVDGLSPGLAISSKSKSMAVVDVTGTERFFRQSSFLYSTSLKPQLSWSPEDSCP